MQLLASSLGARVYAGELPEVGVLPVDAHGRGPRRPGARRRCRRRFPTLQWHGDTFDLPDGAVRLASSPAYPNQAFRYGARAYGVQFHVEVSREMAREWGTVPAYIDYLERTLGDGGIDRLFADFSRGADAMLGHARSMFEAWVEHAVAVAR